MAVSFVVAGAVAAALLVDFGGRGRMLDNLLGKKDDWNSQAPRITRVEAPTETGNRMTVINDIPNPDAPVASQTTAASTPAPAAKAAPAKDSWVKHIKGSLAEYDIKGPATQTSNASASVTDASASAAPAAVAAAPVATLAAVPTASAQPAATAQPAYVNYGSSSRSDIMSSASGPVYNFAGKKR